MPLFSDKDHPNTLAAVIGDPDHIWVLLHNLGEVGKQQRSLRHTQSSVQF